MGCLIIFNVPALLGWYLIFRNGIAFLLLPPRTNPRGTGQVPFLSQILGTLWLDQFASIFFPYNASSVERSWRHATNNPCYGTRCQFSITFRIPIIVTTAVETSGQFNNYYCFFIFNSTSAIHVCWWPTESQGFCQCHSVIAVLSCAQWYKMLIWPKLGADSFARSHQLSLFQLGKTIQGPHPVRTECIPKPFQATNESEESSQHTLYHPRRNRPPQVHQTRHGPYVLHCSRKVSVTGDVWALGEKGFVVVHRADSSLLGPLGGWSLALRFGSPSRYLRSWV